MNKRFYSLPQERQRQMLNAGYKVFSSFPYRKAPTSSIAEAVGISKSLLFHYFENKKGFYLYLFETALKTADSISDEENLTGETDFFMYIIKNLRREIRLMSKYPYMLRFLNVAYFETDPQVSSDIKLIKERYMKNNTYDILENIDRSRFKDPEAPEKLLKLITLAVEGYMSVNKQDVFENPDRAMKEMEQLILSLRDNYYK